MNERLPYWLVGWLGDKKDAGEGVFEGFWAI